MEFVFQYQGNLLWDTLDDSVLQKLHIVLGKKHVYGMQNILNDNAILPYMRTSGFFQKFDEGQDCYL